MCGRLSVYTVVLCVLKIYWNRSTVILYAADVPRWATVATPHPTSAPTDLEGFQLHVVCLFFFCLPKIFPQVSSYCSVQYLDRRTKGVGVTMAVSDQINYIRAGRQRWEASWTRRILDRDGNRAETQTLHRPLTYSCVKIHLWYKGVKTHILQLWFY